MATDTLEIFGTEYTGVTGIKATDDQSGTKIYIRPQGTKSITTNGTAIDVAEYASVDVSVPSGQPELQTKTKTYTPTTSQQTESITADVGYDALEQVNVTVNAVANAEYTVDIGNNDEFYNDGANRKYRLRPYLFVDGAGWVSSDTAGAWKNYSAVPSGTAIIPTESAQTVGGTKHMMEGAVTVNAIPSNYVGSGITQRSSSDLTASGATVTVPSGYYSSNASKAVANGTEGTPTATKGTVSNHSISVTPSVTNTAGYISGGTKTGTAVTVTASELASGNKAITENGTNIDVVGYSTVSVDVQGGGGSGMTVATATATPSSASASISFTGLSGEPTSFAVISSADLATGASPYKTAAVVFDGSDLHGQTITNTSNAQVSYDGTHFSKTYSNGTLTITGSTYWQANQYTLVYTYGGSSANLGMADVQVGSGATSITFTGLTDEPDYFSCIFKSNFSTSSGYQRVIAVVYDGNSTYGLAMDSGAKAESSWSYTYSNGSLTISSQGTNNGGYFHQPGYYQLTYGIGGTVEPTEIEVEPLSVTQNGTYTAPTGKAYSPVTVNVSGGSVNIDTKSMTNSSNQNTSISFSSMKGQPKAFFARCTATLSRSSSNTYYYVADMVYNGTSTVGNMHARSNGQYSNITSGYSWSYSDTTLTLSSSGARNTSPGSFYNGTYELVYIY